MKRGREGREEANGGWREEGREQRSERDEQCREQGRSEGGREEGSSKGGREGHFKGDTLRRTLPVYNSYYMASTGHLCVSHLRSQLHMFGHVRRKDDGYIWRRMLMMELPGKRTWGRPKRRFMDTDREGGTWQWLE